MNDEIWVNEYVDGALSMHMSKALADECKERRIACHRYVRVEEGKVYINGKWMTGNDVVESLKKECNGIWIMAMALRAFIDGNDTKQDETVCMFCGASRPAQVKVDWAEVEKGTKVMDIGGYAGTFIAYDKGEIVVSHRERLCVWEAKYCQLEEEQS